MDLKVYFSDDRIQIKYKDKIIEENNCLFSNKKYIYCGRIIDFDIFIEKLENILNKYKINTNSIIVLCGLNNKKIDFLLITEMLEKMGFRKIRIKKVSEIITDSLSPNNVTVINKFSKFSEIYKYKNKKLIKEFILPNNYLKHLKNNNFYVIGNLKLNKTNTYIIENSINYLIKEL